MPSPEKSKVLVAVDLGAQSCRVSLLDWENASPVIRVVHRFPNAPVQTPTGLRWDFRRILEGVLTGLRLCAAAAPTGIASVAVDGWGVDYIRLGLSGQPLADPFCHRDGRTVSAMRELHRRISPERLYQLTGIQLLSLNTLYQLYADHQSGIDPLSGWLNLPEYVTHFLGGEPVSEFTNATHTQLVALGRQEWCAEIFNAAGFALSSAPRIVPTGTRVGKITGELAALPRFENTILVVPACHDTASAIAAIPASGDDWAFISSGTWSLVGTVLETACVTPDTLRMNFTNLGGVGGSICFLKNVNGMWLLSQCMEEWSRSGLIFSMDELLGRCETLPTPRVFLDVDENLLLLPGNMPAKINAQLVSLGEPALAPNPQGTFRMANLIFHSLAKRYAEVLDSVVCATGKKLKRVFVVGGGSKNDYLNRLLAERSGLEVIRGSSESTTIGNFAIQIAALAGDCDASGGVRREAVARHAELLSHCCLSLSG